MTPTQPTGSAFLRPLCLLLAGLALPAVHAADAEYDATPGLAALGAQTAYDLGITGAGRLVGVIDSGIAPAHREFVGAIADGFSFFTNSSILQDASAAYHGSHVAGTIAARRDGNGMQGVAYGAGLVVGGTNFFPDQLAAAIDFAVARQVDVLNNSWGYAGSTILSYDRNSIETTFPDLLAALQNAVARNTVVVFANGNDGNAHPQVFGGLPYYFPELQRSWITVAASTMDGVYFTPYSNRCGVAVQWCVVAPGGYGGYDGGVVSVDGATPDGYKALYGTSNATPFVSGAIALLAERFPFLSAEQLVAVLLTTAKHGTDAVLSPIYGRGEIDIGKAMYGPAALEFTFDVDTRGHDALWSNAIGGSGALIKRGAGTLALTGSNGFAGGVTVAGGTLRVAGEAALGSGPLTLDGGTLQLAADGVLARDLTVASGGTLDTQAYQLVLNGALHGSGRLHKDGSGTLWLAGSSDFTGTLQIDAGVVQASAQTLSGNVENDATLVLEQTVDGTFAGRIGGNGMLIKRGAGTLTLAAANDYRGGTVVEAGTLSGSSQALQGDIVNHATVVFEQPADGSYAGRLSGSGMLIKRGAGSLTLTGVNSYGGGTTIEAGRLQGDTAALQGRFTGAGTLVLDQATEAVFNGTLDGLGSLEKRGGGVLHLAAAGDSVSVTRLLAGTLQLEGTLVSDVQVAAGGRLAPRGSLTGSVTVAAGGELQADAAAPGRLSGDLTLAPGATLALRLSPDAAGPALSVGGTAAVEGGLQLAVEGAWPALSHQRVLEAGQALTGAPDLAGLALPGLHVGLVRDDRSLSLTLARTDTALMDQTPAGNRRQAAAGLRALLATGYYSPAFASQVNALYQAAPAVATPALETVSGELAADATPALLGLLGQAALAPVLAAGPEAAAAEGPSLLPVAPLRFLGVPESGGAWVASGEARQRVHASAQAGGYTATQRLLAAGADAVLDGAARLGLMAAQGELDLARAGSPDQAATTLSLAGGYGRWRRGTLEWLGGLQLGRADTSATRWISVGTPARVAADYHQDVASAALALRYTPPTLPLAPLAQLGYLRVETPAYQERGGSALALGHPATTREFWLGTAGVQARLAGGLLPAGLQAGMDLLWRHDFSAATAYAQPATFTVSPTAGFTVQPAGPARDAALLRLGLTYAGPGPWRAGLEGRAERAAGSRAAGLALGLERRW